MEIYNRYLINTPYESKIAFLSSGILTNDLFFLNFIDEYRKKRGYYRDQSGYLRSLFWEARRSGVDVNRSVFEKTGLITSLQWCKQFHSYIQVLDDKQNLQLNGQYMIFKFGLRVCNKITDFGPDYFNNIFKLKIELVKPFTGRNQQFPNYDKSEFLEKYYTQLNPELPLLETFIHFPNFNLQSIKRKEKLEKIFNL